MFFFNLKIFLILVYDVAYIEFPCAWYFAGMAVSMVFDWLSHGHAD